MKNEKNYYIGLDIGTDSIGYAVTAPSYKPLKFHGEPMMGTHLLDAAEENAARRTFRTARRRLDRKQQRVLFIREIFAEEISKTDPDFFRRLDCSALHAEDKVTPSRNSFFNDPGYHDREYHRDYPTIHHLICDLMDGKAKQDVRLLYLAVAWLVAHRGHFLNEVDKNDIEGVLDFKKIYDEFLDYFETPIWVCDATSLSDVLQKKCGVTAKEKELISLLFGGKKPKSTEEDIYSIAHIVKLLAGGSVKPIDLYNKNEVYAERKTSISLSMDEEEFETLLGELGDDGEVLVLLKKLYDWSILADLVPNGSMISETKVQIYEQHRSDLRYLKAFIRKYKPEKYREIFRASKKELNNYVAYSYNLKNAEHPEAIEKKATKENFSEYILKLVKDISVEDCDRAEYEDMLRRLDKNVLTFLPKQVDGDNRLIPYQLYYVELVKILESAKAHYPFLSIADADSLTPCDKILSTFLYRIPYYVGPLNRHSDNSWFERKSERSTEKITPWNFDEVVDRDASEQAFIRRMTNQCTYLPGNDVLPKNSLLYTRFEVLNEINNLRINGEKIDVETKQQIFTDLFIVYPKVTLKRIREYLISACKMDKEAVLSGVDITIKSSMKSYIFFRPYLEKGLLSEEDAEKILNTKAYSEDTYRFKKWLEMEYPSLTDSDCKKISGQKFKEFGRLSRRFLSTFMGADSQTGEAFTIMDALWNTNNNLMQLLSDSFTFRENIEKYTTEYYDANPKTLSERMDEMYIPTAVKRPVIRTLDIVKDIKKAMNGSPTKIFIEMARGGTKEQKNKRIDSRRQQILALYDQCEEDVSYLREQLETKDDRELQAENLYLYFTQFGRCMYSGEVLDITKLGTGVYDIDHIYPRSFVKDDSIVNNKVLVLSSLNREKSNEYPISSAIRSEMYIYWKKLHDSNLISDEKFKRLTRSTQFDVEERWGFINRQLVETRQSTKAVAALLKEIFPDTEIVYVKAGMVSEFRQAFDLPKARSINDLHHAKDAYLNIVVGNVYNSVFTRQWFNPENTNYSIKMETFFDRSHVPGGISVWNGSESLAYVKSVMAKNNIHLTKYALCSHGKLFDVTPLKADKNKSLVPRKKGLEPAKYGGYNKTTASYFMLIRYMAKMKKDLIFMPIELMYADKFEKDRVFAIEYAKKTITGIIKAEPTDIEFIRKIKVNTVIELDGFKILISGKTNSGDRFTYTSHIPLKIDPLWEKYIKKLESFSEKQKKNPNYKIQSSYDKITSDENVMLYSIYCEKSTNPFFNKTLCAKFSSLLCANIENFTALSLEDQSKLLLNIGSVFKNGRKGGCDFSLIGGKKDGGALSLSSRVSNWKKNYSTAYIVDSSASGLYETKSENLFDLL